VADSPDEIQHNNKGQQPEHGDLYHYVYVFGATLGVGLIDFLFFWHDNHLIALLIGAAWLALVSVFELRHDRKWQIGVPIGRFAAALIANYIIGPVRMPEIEVIGTLQPGGDPEPQNGCPASNSPEAWKILFGTSGIQFGSYGEYPLLQVGSCKVIFVKRGPDGISVSADLFDGKGRLVAAIKNNEFHALTGDNVRVDRGHSLSTLTVRDGDGNELLFVNYLNRATVRVRGLFGCYGYRLVPVRDDSPIPGFNMGGHCINVMGGITVGNAFFSVR
jgi:hypothetical protein